MLISQQPVTLDDLNEPEPDVAIVRGSLRDYYDRHPGPDDLSLVVEVADSSLSIHQGMKARLYARFGLPDYWLVNLNTYRVVVYREPKNGEYTSVEVLPQGGRIAPLAAPERAVSVNDVLLPMT
jgi:Uma2 family endonuclease